jgi:hypothetical protein
MNKVGLEEGRGNSNNNKNTDKYVIVEKDADEEVRKYK